MNELDNPYYSPSQFIQYYTSTVGKPFALKIETEAMSPRFPSGSILLIDPDRTPIDCDFLLVRNHLPDLQLRQLFINNQFHYLEAHNPKCERLILSKNDRILGVVFQIIICF